jgi:hypothetical protein
MKTADKKTATERNYSNFVSGLSEKYILNSIEMLHVRGGEGEGNGCEPIIISPIKS